MSEGLMSGRNKNSLRLIPIGILYTISGCLIVTVTGGQMGVIAALILTCLGLAAIFMTRSTSHLRR